MWKLYVVLKWFGSLRIGVYHCHLVASISKHDGICVCDNARLLQTHAKVHTVIPQVVCVCV